MRLSDKRIKARIDKGEIVCVKKGMIKLFLTLNTYEKSIKILGKMANGGWEMTNEKPYGWNFL